MAGIIPSLFGPTPEELMSLQRKEQNQAISQAGQLYGPKGATGAAIGTALARGANKLFGLEDPEIKKANDVYAILKTTQQELGADAVDPSKLYVKLQENFANAGYGDIAEKVATEGAPKILEWNAKKADTAIKQDTLVRETGFNTDLKQAQIDKGTTPLTPDEVTAIGLKYGTRKDIMDWASREDNQNRLIENKIKDLEIQALKEGNKLSERDKLAIKFDYDKKLAEFTAGLKGNKNQTYKTYDTLVEKINDPTYGVLQGDQPAKEKTIARRIGTDAKEVTQGIDQMMTLTNGGTIHIAGTTFADVKTNGFLSATGKDLTNQLSDQQSKLYDAIMYPLAKGVALYSNPDYRPNQADVENAQKSYKTQAGENHVIALGKMAELKKNFLSVSESYLDSHMLNPSQAKALKDQIKYVQKAIPWNVDDVSNFMKSGQSDKMKFKDFLDSKVPQAAIDKLKADPSLAGQFDAKFGAGSSGKYLKD
jgi:hypothetical protein